MIRDLSFAISNPKTEDIEDLIFSQKIDILKQVLFLIII